MAVAFEELDNSPEIRFADGRLVATRRLKIDWADRFDFLIELYGGYRFVGGQFVFTPPAPFPAVPQAFVTDVEVAPFPPDRPDGSAVQTLAGGTNAYPFAVVTATYRIQFDDNNQSRDDLPQVPEGTFLTYRGDLGSEYTSIPGRVWNWKVAGDPKLPADVNPGLLVPTEDFTLTWHRVPRPPWDAIRDLRGTLNDATFLNHAAGTVLFLGARTERDFQLQDTGLWRLEYQFKVREVPSTASPAVRYGWNRFYREEAVGGEHWLEIEDADGNPPYVSGNFHQLFQFA